MLGISKTSCSLPFKVAGGQRSKERLEKHSVQDFPSVLGPLILSFFGVGRAHTL